MGMNLRYSPLEWSSITKTLSMGAATTGLSFSGAYTDGISISGICVDGIQISSANTGHHINMTGTWGQGIAGGAIVIGDYSTALALGEVSEHIVGVCVHLSGSTDDTSNFIPIHGKFTTTADCATNAGAQAVYGRIDIKHDLSSSYAVRGAITIDTDATAPSVNQVYGMFSTMALANCVLEATGQVAGIAVELTGSEDITTVGSGHVSGIRISWEHTNQMTVETNGIYLAVHGSSYLDTGYLVNASGTLVNSFCSELTSGSITTAFRIEGAHTNAFAFPAVGTAPCATYTSQEAPTGKIKILVGTEVRYLAYWD